MKKMKKRNKKIFLLCTVLAFVFIAVAATIVISNAIVLCSPHSIYEPQDIPDESYDCILVLGAGLREDKTPSKMLADRLDCALELYQLGVCDTILLSGDRKSDEYDEPQSMYDYLEAAGVPGEAMICDGEGFSTYESITRAKDVYGVKKSIIVTQSYHLVRALYIANNLDIESVGASADTRRYAGQLWRNAREIVARTKDFFAVLTY